MDPTSTRRNSGSRGSCFTSFLGPFFRIISPMEKSSLSSLGGIVECIAVLWWTNVPNVPILDLRCALLADLDDALEMHPRRDFMPQARKEAIPIETYIYTIS
mmetsp:Transcript_36775/g.64178  ORF Transcript_36775/g.64178 Transcript_36775/m.64178 type:complete len:102 (+) Transcript_36775:190-495(+)